MSGVRLPSHIPSVTTGSYPVRAGNRVRALVDGEAAFTRICEAVEAAERSVWVTIAYLDKTFEMPGGRGSFFDVLDRAAGRGIDVRAIFWRTDHEAGHFYGNDEERAWLAERGSRFQARWDRAARRYCQHQKSWLIDAGRAGETAFVGGINLNPDSVTAAGHTNRGGAHTHDVYCELAGPGATDVHHNFVQRWNEASERAHDHGVWPAGGNDDLEFPSAVSPMAGDTIVQMQRTIRAGHHRAGTAAPGGAPFDIAKGEHSIFDQYVAAIDAARETIYIEDQYIAAPEIVAHLLDALKRGVDVVFVAPGDPEQQVKDARANPDTKPFFDFVGTMGTFDHFVMAGIAAPDGGTLRDVYVHDKIMIVDDCWATIGSCNIANQSFFCDAELNASVWDAGFARALRAELFGEHLNEDTAALDGRAAMARFRAIARENAVARSSGRPLQGLAYAMDPARYGQ